MTTPPYTHPFTTFTTLDMFIHLVLTTEFFENEEDEFRLQTLNTCVHFTTQVFCFPVAVQSQE